MAKFYTLEISVQAHDSNDDRINFLEEKYYDLDTLEAFYDKDCNFFLGKNSDLLRENLEDCFKAIKNGLGRENPYQLPDGVSYLLKLSVQPSNQIDSAK